MGYDYQLKKYHAPWFLGTINRQNVLRTNALLGNRLVVVAMYERAYLIVESGMEASYVCWRQCCIHPG